MEKRDIYCPNGDPHTHMNWDSFRPVWRCTWCGQIITALWKKFWTER